MSSRIILLLGCLALLVPISAMSQTLVPQVVTRTGRMSVAATGVTEGAYTGMCPNGGAYLNSGSAVVEVYKSPTTTYTDGTLLFTLSSSNTSDVFDEHFEDHLLFRVTTADATAGAYLRWVCGDQPITGGSSIQEVPVLPPEVNPTSTAYNKSGRFWVYDRLPMITNNGYDLNGSMWNFSCDPPDPCTSGVDAAADWISVFSEVYPLYSAAPSLNFFGSDFSYPLGGDSILTINSVDQTWPNYSDQITWEPGAYNDEDIDYQFCRNSSSPYAPSNDNTSNTAYPNYNWADAWICKDESADIYYKLSLAQYNGCNSAGVFTSDVYVVPFAAAAGDTCQPYSFDRSHTTYYGARFDGQNILLLTDADSIENNLWPSRESCTTAGWSISSGTLNVTTANPIDRGWNTQDLDAGLGGCGVQCTGMNVSDTCDIDPVPVRPGTYQFSIVLRGDGITNNFEFSPIDENGTDLPDDQVAMYLLMGGASIRDSTTAYDNNTKTKPDQTIDWVKLQGWIKVADETRIGLRTTANETTSTIYFNKWGLERSKTDSLNVQDHYVLQPSVNPLRIQVVGDSQVDDSATATAAQTYKSTISNGIRYMAGLPAVGVGLGSSLPPLNIPGRSTSIRPDLNITKIDSRYGVGGSKLRDKLGWVKTGGVCVQNTDNIMERALSEDFEVTFINAGQNDMVGAGIQADMPAKDSLWPCISWQEQLMQLDRLIQRSNRKSVIYALNAPSRAGSTAAGVHLWPCLGGGGSGTEKSCWEVYELFNSAITRGDDQPLFDTTTLLAAHTADPDAHHVRYELCSMTFDGTATVDTDWACPTLPEAATLTSFSCTAMGSTAPDTQVLTVVECDADGASCATTGGTVTLSALNSTQTDATFSDASIAAGNVWRVDNTSLTTAGGNVTCTVEGHY